MITACITATIEALDASLALNRNGVYSSVTFMPESDVYSSVAYALRLWAGSHQAEIEIRQEEHGVVNYVQHQRDFTARMERRAARLQELLPCPTAHEHTESCYPAELVKRVTGEVQS